MTEKDTRPRFPGICSECGKQFWATKSIAMEDFGMDDFGGGQCCHCKALIHLIFRPETQDFESESYDVYSQRLRAE